MNYATYDRGFTLVEILIVVAIISLLVTMATANYLNAQKNVKKDMCISNLTKIEYAIQEWAFKNNLASEDSVTTPVLTPYLRHNVFPKCPMAGTYAVTTVGEHPTCSREDLGHKLGE